MSAEEPKEPCKEEVRKYLQLWEGSSNYVDQESAIDKLYVELLPTNKRLEDILLKVSVLNDFYSTRIFDTYSVAKHIHELDIDERLKSEDLCLVKDITEVKLSNGETRKCYSFATKYCSHHKPKKFPIYDSNVDKVLRYFRKRDCFTKFKNDDLKDYRKFVEIINAFMSYYDLNEFSYKELDRYLWQLGKDYFPKNNNKKSKTSK